MAVDRAANLHHAVTSWQCGDRSLPIGQMPHFMGIVNVTPDSFSDGGRFNGLDAAVAQAAQLIADGATIIDVGGESTRPDAVPVSLDEELRRVLPVIEAIAARWPVAISVDTTKAEVARQALAAGACIVNDISGLLFDPAMPDVCAQSGAGVVAMHIQGTPQTMQKNPTYADVVSEVTDFLCRRVDQLEAGGIRRASIAIDPGIGFGKTAQHNVQLLSAIPRLKATGQPLLIGHSRKRFIGKVLGRSIDERSFGTVGVSLASLSLGADILRLHDVAPSRECWLTWNAVMQGQMPVESPA